MKILFSPSEAKSPKEGETPLDIASLLFGDKLDQRSEAIERYLNFIDDSEYVAKFFGGVDSKELLTLGTIKAVERYSGVAYKHLDYPSLSKEAQHFCDENLIIFSNLFGAIRGRDKIPPYTLKQGKKIDNFAIERFYKEHFSESLDKMLKGEVVIDLRASFYEKFYKLNQQHTTYTFIKDGKSVSHFAKLYRGLIARSLAQKPTDDIVQLDSLELMDIHEQGLKREIIYRVKEH